MKNSKTLAAFLTIVVTLISIVYSCKKTDPQKSTNAIAQNQGQTKEDDGIIRFESRYDETSKVKLEIEKTSDGYNVKKWIVPISENDPVDYSTLIIGGEIISSSDNSLKVNLPDDKVFRQVEFDPGHNDPTAIQLGGWEFTCHCCADTDNGGTTPTGLGMCKVNWGYYKGILTVNCSPENCISLCGMEVGPIGGIGGTHKPNSVILDAANINIELMQ